MNTYRVLVTAVALAACGAASAWGAPAPDSRRLAQGKDYIADEQWPRAIAELSAAADDPHERNRDEALFWLAHSQHQSGDDAASLQSIARLERQYPASRWVRLANAVRVEIAQRMRRDDVLWAIALPPPPPGLPPRPSIQAPPSPPRSSPPRSSPPQPSTPQPSTPPAPLLPPSPPALVPVPPAAPSEFWVGRWPPSADPDLRIEVLGDLLESHGDRAVPLLREIALDGTSPAEARRALFVLAQSARPDARRTIVEIARTGTEPVRLAAIREMGRFTDVDVSTELMRVYSTAPTSRVRSQVVTSLGDLADNASLFRIVRAERDPGVRNTAILTLGRIPAARPQLRTLYQQAPPASREAVLTALFAAKDEDELMRIAASERDPILHARARMQLRLLATPKALKFLAEHP